MAKSKAETQSKNALVKLVSSLLPGKHNTIPLSLPVAQALGGDLEAAIIFSQCMYWSERTDDPDGYFYKCYDEWYEETTIKERTCRDRIKKLEAKGWIHTLVMHVYGVPKLHIRVLPENFVEDLIESHDKTEREKLERAEKKEKDLRKRREKRAMTSNPCVSTIRQNLPDANGNNCRMETAEVAGSIDTKTTNRNYITETTEYIKAPGRADTGESNFETSFTSNGEQHSGTASPGSQQDNRRRETHETQSETDLYSTPWNPKTEAFREDDRGWAVMPPTNKHKLVRFITTRAMQMELLEELDEEFSAVWYEDESKLWITTTYAESGWEEDVLGTVASTGAHWIEYDNEDEDYCTPGNASLRVLRDWGYQRNMIGQTWYNERLKELWDDATRFCKKHGDRAKEILDSRPIWECVDIDIQLDD